MPHPRSVLVLGFACLVVVTLCFIIPWGPWVASPRGQVLVPAGTVLRLPGFENIGFTVPSAGGVLVGSAEADHTSVGRIGAFPVGTGWACPPPPTGPWGDPYSYTADQNLTAGAYTWGAFCGGWGNITVTQSIEVVYNDAS
jgi:hypothetical protein